MLASAIALGFVAGVALGGNWRRLARLEIRWLPLLLAAIAVRVAGLFLPFWLLLYLGAVVAIAVVAIANRHLPGALLIAGGSLLNALVIGLNGGMPVDMTLAREVGAFSFEADRLHVPLAGGTVLPFLADVIPIGLVRNVYSVGDVVIAAGGFWLPFSWLRRA